MAVKKWIKGAIKRPGALRRKFGAKDNIPAGKLQTRKRTLQAKAKGEKKLSATELRELRQINLALTLRGPKVGRRGRGK